MENEHSVAAHWQGDFDEAGLRTWAEYLRQQLKAPRVSLGLIFLAPRLFPHAQQVLEIVRVHAQVPLLAGCSSGSLIAGGQEIEEQAGLALALYALPGADLKAFHFTQNSLEESNGPGYWQMETGVGNDQTNGWLVFADPFHLDSEAWLRSWNEAYAPLPVLGGLASGDFSSQTTQVYLNGEVFEEGGVAISVGGAVGLHGVISQGCTPIGETWTLTRVDGNVIQEIGNRPAYEVLVETFNTLPTREQRKTSGNLFIGLVVNEYLEEFHRGDFLVRNLLGVDPKSGVIAVGAQPRAGQTVQFHRRDAAAATEDMAELLARAHKQLGGAAVYGGCLCCCNGRGRGLFGAANHDARMIQEKFGPLGMAGFFCNGEIGPVGERNFLHGYTASLALFVRKPQPTS
jgi:small ligand-binding sensory domain FIST